MDQITKALASTIKDLFSIDINPTLTRPDEQFGDYSTNVALQIFKQLDPAAYKGPRVVAEQIVERIGGSIKQISKLEVAGAGFINIWLSDDALISLAARQPQRSLAGKTVVAEYSDPNPFKVLHAGHLYTSIVGDAIANLLEMAGANVHRVNFGGDVGLHVGKTMYVILKRLGGENLDKLTEIAPDDRSEWLASAYVEGSNLYEDNQDAKTEIIALNKRVYQVHADKDHDSGFAQIYWTTRQWSYEYFDEFYKMLGSSFEKYYPESETSEIGLKTVREHVGSVFIESEGAVIFRGEDYGLHTRVFINSEGLPTYEAKDVGLIMAKKRDYNFDMSVIITGNEQEQYMSVVLKAIEQFAPKLARATKHLTHGMVKLAGGEKMSSRKGNILRAVDVIEAARAANAEVAKQSNEQSTLAAVKYAFLKTRIGGDIIYSPAESVAIEGNSGPYLQYAHARARSILSKVEVADVPADGFETDERSLLRKLGEYSEVVEQAVESLMPHLITTYLYELAQNFNRFYEHNRVANDPREAIRAQLVQAYADTLKNGLELLNISAPDRM